jgi:hypothetical protein
VIFRDITGLEEHTMNGLGPCLQAYRTENGLSVVLWNPEWFSGNLNGPEDMECDKSLPRFFI